MIRLIINGIPPSNNKYMGKGSIFKHAHAYQEEKRTWHMLIASALVIAKQNLPAKIIKRLPFQKAMVQITYHFPDKRRRDPDNYSGKMLLDPLTEMGIIKDDSFDCIQLKIEGGYDKENPRTEIRITRLEGER